MVVATFANADDCASGVPAPVLMVLDKDVLSDVESGKCAGVIVVATFGLGLELGVGGVDAFPDVMPLLCECRVVERDGRANLSAEEDLSRRFVAKSSTRSVA